MPVSGRPQPIEFFVQPFQYATNLHDQEYTLYYEIFAEKLSDAEGDCLMEKEEPGPD